MILSKSFSLTQRALSLKNPSFNRKIPRSRYATGITDPTVSTAKEPFTLEPLPYPRSSLAPYMSEETIDYHYGKHHAGYISKLNSYAPAKMENTSLVDLISSSSGSIYDNAAQAWNHTFFWNCMSPQGGKPPQGILAEKIDQDFGSLENFQLSFVHQGIERFGSGWIWLVLNTNTEKLEIITTQNASNPLTLGLQPLLGCDIWEHAYYIDYRNARQKYLENWWNIVNWKFAEQNLNVL